MARFVPRRMGTVALFAALLALVFYTVARPAGSPSVTPDKEQYLAGETAVLTGANFSLNQSYDIVVVRPNGTMVKGDGTETPGFDAVTSSASGAFVYNYATLPEPIEINGRYDVSVFASSDVAHATVIAATVFFVDDAAYPTSINKVVSGLQVTLNGSRKGRGGQGTGFAG